ncbi:MAG: hypothetical protein U0528_01655 [Anaerolineae bacterium]
MQHGTTTIEIKTGYGLSVEAEMSLLNAIALLDVEHPLDIVPTFLARTRSRRNTPTIPMAT